MIIQQKINSSIEQEEFNRRNNLWFIKLRWYAVTLLIIFILAVKFIFAFELSNLQFYSYSFVTILIAVYNYFFYLRKKSNKSGVRESDESLYQILLDLLALSMLVYFSGGIEAPIFLLFIFHMIIGSIILPKYVMYKIASLLIIFLSVSTSLEYYDIITHQNVKGLYSFQLYKSENFILGFLTLFSFIMLMSINITSRIVGELYSRQSQLRRALKEVDEAEQSKQKYLMAVVHELKSPIAAASANLDLVLGNYTGAVSETAIEKLTRSKERLNDSISSINNLLRFSQFRLMNKLELEPVIINELLNDILEKYNLTAQRKNIIITFNSSKQINYIGDKVLLNLAISNLIANSLKYTQENGKIVIELHERANELHFSISDNGIGIPVDDLPKIFDEYYRASNVKAIEGTGTGLATIKRIIESHNGKIEAKSPSEIGNLSHPGTRFEILLPQK